MSKSEPLFLLIKSLSRSEKRYFRIFTDNDKNYNNYLKLFDAIDTQDKYDEGAIKNRFADERFTKQLHVTKNYLTRLIYKSIRNYHAQNSTATRVRDLLTTAEVLFNKELFDHCKKVIMKAERFALKHEQFADLVEIYDWQRKLEQQENPHAYPVFKSILAKQAEALEKMNNQNTYLHLIVDVSSSIMAGSPAKVPNEEMLEDEQHALSMEARVMHYNARYFRNIQLGESALGEQDLRDLIAYMEGRPDWITSRPGTYVATINNLITYYVFTKNTAEALQLIYKAKEVYASIRPTSDNKSLLKQILRTYNVELEIYRDQHLYRENPVHITTTENVVLRYQYKMPREYLISFWFQFGYIRFLQQDLTAALRWVNEIIQTNFREIRLDIQVSARFLNLMIHLEQRNMFVLRYFVDSTRRFIKKRKPIQSYERLLLAFFSRMGRVPESEFRDNYKAVYDQLFPYKAESLIEQGQLDYLDYRSWLESKF